MSNLKQNGRLRWSPSYLRRQGQMTPGQKRAFREHWESFGLPFRYGETIRLDEVFGRKGPLFLEIGFGMGETLVRLATLHPGANLLGIEVHKPGIGAALMKIAGAGISNIRLMRGDARLILSDYLDPKTTRFDRVSVLFPDPWPEEENAHRRIIQSDFLELIESRMAASGSLHIATDVDNYRSHVEKVLGEREGWKSLEGFDLEDFRGPTQYERKGLEKGHVIHDLIFRWDYQSAIR